MSKELKQLILDTFSDGMLNILYYDRKEDDDLPVDAIQQAVEDGIITKEEILEEIEKALDAEPRKE